MPKKLSDTISSKTSTKISSKRSSNISNDQSSSEDASNNTEPGNIETRKIVSSRHLANEEGWPLSEVEFGLTVFYNAFTKWVVRCSAAAGQYDLSSIDVLTLHNIHHRDNEQRRIDICFMLNIEDSHTVNYSLKKLIKLDLIIGNKRGKEIFYATTDKGHDLCEEYREIRQQCLLSGLKSVEKDAEELSSIAATLRSLSGLYDQAARSAASMS